MSKNTSMLGRLAPKRNAWIAALVALLGVTNSALAKKGGNGGGNGGGGEDPPPPPAVELVPAPVEYMVSWFAIEGTDLTRLYDVNLSGHAVGIYRVAGSDKLRGLLAQSDGTWWDLHDYFGVSEAFPGWRLTTVQQINAAGLVAGGLVPDDQPGVYESPVSRLVVGNIYADPPLLAEVPIQLDSMYRIEDLNEQGDVLVTRRNHDGSGAVRHVYWAEADGYTGPTIVPDRGELNSMRWIMYTEHVFETKGRRQQYVGEASSLIYPDGTTESLGLEASALGEDGSIYALIDEVPSRQYPSGQWEPVAPSGGWFLSVSGAQGAESTEALIYMPVETGMPPYLVYREVFGTFAVEVTSGLNGPADAALWNGSGIASNSRPGPGGSGYLCGPGSGDGPAFILTPIPVTP